MPEGILIISWDEFEGGIVSFKYPDIFVPPNIVQLLQISHSFNPGIINIQEEEFHALSIGNEDLQKVIVLILSKYEDSNDFEEILQTMVKAVSESQDEFQIKAELKRLYTLSQSVFRARDAVLNKLANEVTGLKNREIDLKQSLEWLITNEENLRLRIIYILMRYGNMSKRRIKNLIEVLDEKLDSTLDSMLNEKIINIKDSTCYLLIHYLV